MEKFQGLILKLAETHPNAPLTPVAKTHVQNRLNQLFSQYKAPDHPPYSAMIERALQELNEKGGSSEDSIFQFLEKEYNDLPCAHSTLLKHHLGKLSESGDIVPTLEERYVLVGVNPSPNSSSKSKRKRKSPVQRKWKWRPDRERKRNRRCQKQVIEKRNQQKGDKFEVTERHWEGDVQEQQLTENGVNGGEKQVEEDHAKRLQSCDDGENGVNGDPRFLPTEPPGMITVNTKRTSEVRPRQQEIRPTEIKKANIGGALQQEQQEGEQAEDKLPQTPSSERPPGFESVRVENSSYFGVDWTNDCSLQEHGIVVEAKELLDLSFRNLNKEAKPKSVIPEGPTDHLQIASTEELSESKRAQRQLRCSSSILPEFNAVTMTYTDLATSSRSDDHYSLQERPQDQQNTPESTPITEQEKQQSEHLKKDVVTEIKHRGIKIYTRRGKAKSQQPEIVFEDEPMKLEQLAELPIVNLLELN